MLLQLQELRLEASNDKDVSVTVSTRISRSLQPSVITHNKLVYSRGTLQGCGTSPVAARLRQTTTSGYVSPELDIAVGP